MLFLAAVLHALKAGGNFAHALDDSAQLMQPDKPAESISDGSVFSVADSKANAEYGYPSCAKGITGNPSLRACFVMDAASHMFVEAITGGYSQVSEQELGNYAISMTAEPGVLFELDRGFYSVNRMREILATGAHALCRVPKHVKLPVLKHFEDGSYLSFVRDNNLSAEEFRTWLYRELVRKRLDKPNGRACPRAIKSRRSKHKTRPRGSPCSTYPSNQVIMKKH